MRWRMARSASAGSGANCAAATSRYSWAAGIKTGAQRATTYLLSPLLRFTHDSLHER